MTPLERAARAVHHHSFSDRHWEDLPVSDQERHTATARAVLTAIREPSEGMIEAGASVDAWVQHEGQAPQPEIWQAMIDAMLNRDAGGSS